MSFHMYFLSLCFKPWYRYCGFLNIWLNSGVTLDYTLNHFFLVSCVRKKSVPKKKKCCLCAGADSDWHHLEFVTCWEDHAQRVERAWVWGVKSHDDKTASPQLTFWLYRWIINICVFTQRIPVFIPTCYFVQIN